MNKIEKLIAELCPDSVEWKKLGEVCKVLRGERLTKKELSSEFQYPVFHGGLIPLGYYYKYNREANKTMIINTGSIGEVVWSSVPFWSSDGTFTIETQNNIIDKFLYYYLKIKESYLKSQKREGGVPTIDRNVIENLPIPIPPLPIQEEIVKILDTFTELEAALELKLEAELEARKKQYEYYRNTLLTPVEHNGRWYLNGKEVEWKKLGEIGTLIRGSGLQKKDFTESGVGCIHYGQIYTYYGTFADRTISFVSEETAKNLKKVSKGDLVITSTSENIEDVCKSVAWVGDNEIVTGGHAIILKHYENAKFLSYYFQTRNFFIQKIKYAKGTKVIDISVGDLAKIPIPIPPLSEQERIVAILDKFDALVNDISQGLPAEIEARRKQYEYYRNKLLDFCKGDSYKGDSYKGDSYKGDSFKGDS